MRRLALACLLGLTLAGQAGADAAAVLRGFAADLYAAERAGSGGAPVWERLEARTLRALEQEAGTIDLVDAQGRTPLMLAAANGYGFAVRWILGREAGRATLGRRDQDGLTALDLARLAVRQTALACRPRADGRGVEKPLLTTLAYYLDRRPYPSVVRALVDAGAGAGPARARAHWLAVCPGAPPDLRARVDRGAALQRTLLQGAHDILLARCTEQARLRHRGILRLFGGREDATGVIDQSREQVQARIEACAADLAGFVPD